MALQSALTRPRGEIKVVLAQYPMTNFLPLERPMGIVPPEAAWLDAYVEKMRPGDVCSSSNPATDERRRGLSMALNAYGRFNEFFGTGKELWPVKAVEDVDSLPPMTIIHGRQDSLVKVGDTEEFVRKARAVEEEEEEEEVWLRRGLKWVEEKWLV